MTDEPLILDFNQERHVAPRQQKIANRPIKRVCVEFYDGDVLNFTLPNEGQGIYRETLTYEEAIDGSRTQNRLRLFNLFWTVKEPV